jgi:2-keto-4-pentenoate hydratase
MDQLSEEAFRMTTASAAAAAKLFVDIRGNKRQLGAVPEELVPQNRDEAYAIQDGIVALQGPLGGWKVAAGTGPDPICSPLPASVYIASGDHFSIGKWLATLIETEVAVGIGRDLPQRGTPYSRDEVKAAMASLHPAIEVIGSRFVAGTTVPQLLGIGDLQNNAAVLIGPAVTNWSGLDLKNLRISLRTGGIEIGTSEGGPDIEAVIDALTWLANHAAARQGGLRAGQFIITGSRIVRPIGKPGETVEADFGAFGSLRISLEA